MRNYAAMAKASGFTDAAVLPVRELVVVPEYRRFCAQNLCGNYGVLPACPPMSGTVEEMTADMRRYQTALLLMIETTPVDYWDTAEQKAAKKHQNLLTEQLMEQMRADGLTDLLMMGAGPVPIPARVAEANGIVINHLGETMSRVIEQVKDIVYPRSGEA